MVAVPDETASPPDEPTNAQGTPPHAPGRSRRWIALAGVAAFVAGGIAVAAIVQSGGRDKPHPQAASPGFDPASARDACVQRITHQGTLAIREFSARGSGVEAAITHASAPLSPDEAAAMRATFQAAVNQIQSGGATDEQALAHTMASQAFDECNAIAASSAPRPFITAGTDAATPSTAASTGADVTETYAPATRDQRVAMSQEEVARRFAAAILTGDEDPAIYGDPMAINDFKHNADGEHFHSCYVRDETYRICRFDRTSTTSDGYFTQLFMEKRNDGWWVTSYASMN